jgi:hypothetical protein
MPGWDTPAMDAVKLTVVDDEMEAEMLCGQLRTHELRAAIARRTSREQSAPKAPASRSRVRPGVLVHQPELEAARKLLRRR